MLAVWGFIEADFQRDYSIDLETELPRMSWRRFTTLLNGLSPFGVLATHYKDELKKQHEREDAETAKRGKAAPAAVQSFWAAVTSVRPNIRD